MTRQGVRPKVGHPQGGPHCGFHVSSRSRVEVEIEVVFVKAEAVEVDVEVAEVEAVEVEVGEWFRNRLC